MSVLVKGMKMPKNCMLCNFCVEEADPANGEMCLVTGRLMPPCNHERLDDCPLVPIPPHARLIDADELKSYMEECKGENAMAIYATGYARSFIDNAPTVIPADKDGGT